MLTDAGPLVALLNRRDRNYRACVGALRQVSKMETVLPALTEAMHILGNQVGWPAQNALWRLISAGDVVALDVGPAELTRAGELMRQYRDVPMDFADATLVSVAERRTADEIFTLDRRGFTVYRLPNRRAFTILP